MTVPIRQRAALPASDEAADVRRGAAEHDRAKDVGVLPAKPRHAGCGLIPLPRLSARDHDDVTVVRLRGELDLSGTAVLQAQLRDTWWQARLRSVADLTGLPFPGCAFLSVPARRGKPIRERVGNVALGGPRVGRRARGRASHRHAGMVRGA
jgi:anti-anti-sigma factor